MQTASRFYADGQCGDRNLCRPRRKKVSPEVRRGRLDMHNAEVTYWLKLDNAFYRDEHHRPLICSQFIQWYASAVDIPKPWTVPPKWIKVTVSPFKRSGYTECTQRLFSVHIGGFNWSRTNAAVCDLMLLPQVFWFEIEEWE